MPTASPVSSATYNHDEVGMSLGQVVANFSSGTAEPYAESSPDRRRWANIESW